MSDLVKRLRGLEVCYAYAQEAADRIEQLERELAIAEKMSIDANEAFSQSHEALCDALDQLAAEKALADRLAHEVEHSGVAVSQGLIAYRKARGL